MPSRRLPLVLTALLLLCAIPAPLSSGQDTPFTWPPSHVVITEVLVSASGEDYNGTDWNGDSDIGSSSDQFLELWNPTNESIDISNWRIDDAVGSGSAPCSIGWNTTLEPDARMAFFRANTRIEFDYWDGDTINIMDSDGTLVHSMSYPGEDSWWDTPYHLQSNGSWVKGGDPSPGAQDESGWTGPSPGGTCYSMSETRHEGEYILTGRIVTMTSESAFFDGGMLIRDGIIESIWSGTTIPTEHDGIDVIDTDGTIYPGLIDAHNHIHYNTVPLWDVGDNVYDNRYQWKNHPGYKPEVTWPKTILSSGAYWNMEIEALKYAEMKSIVGGTTAVQGNPTSDDSAYTWVLSRNVEHHNFGRDQMHTKVTELESEYVGNHIKTGSADGTLDAWFLHLSEGTDSSSLNEFQILVDNSLLVPELMLIHGVPLGANEYSQMGAVGASLVWSPTSNLLLYGQTADVAAAHDAGINIALAPDWSPSGSKSPLHELKLADWLDANRFGDIFTDYEQVQMVTTNVADGIGWTDDVGRIQNGLAADLVVINTFHDNPYRNIIDAIDPDVSLTIVGGLPIYGDVDLMTALNGVDQEAVTWNGMTKAVDVTFVGVDDGEKSWADIESGLQMALEFDQADMYAHFGAADGMSFTEFQAWADDQWDDLDAVGLDSIFTWGDERYFERLNGSVGFNQIGTIDLWSAYYDVQYDGNFERTMIDSNYSVDPTNPDPTDVPGCIDYAAENFDSAATVDDGSCTYSTDTTATTPQFDNLNPILVEMEVSYVTDGDRESGIIKFELYPAKAPYHVHNILGHIDAGNYDDAIFHRVIDNFMIQGGDFEFGEGIGGHASNWYGYCNGAERTEICDETAWTIPDEADNGLQHTSGALSMAKTSAPNTGGSQFFIVDKGEYPAHLDGIHTIFGRVIEGMDVVDAISEVETNHLDKPVDDVTIVTFKRTVIDDDSENNGSTNEKNQKSDDSGYSDNLIYAGIAAAGLLILLSFLIISVTRRRPESGIEGPMIDSTPSIVVEQPPPVQPVSSPATPEPVSTPAAQPVSASPVQDAPPSTMNGQMMHGYEGLEYPIGSDVWWYRDQETRQWKIWNQ